MGSLDRRVSELMLSVILDYKHNSELIRNCLVWNGALFCKSLCDVLDDEAKCLFVEYSSDSFVKLSDYHSELKSQSLPANFSMAYIPRDSDTGDENIDYKSYSLHPATYPVKFELIIINGKAKAVCTRYARNLIAANSLIIIPNAEELRGKLPKDLYIAEFTHKTSGVKLLLMSAIKDLFLHICIRANDKFSDNFELKLNFDFGNMFNAGTNTELPSILFIHQYDSKYLSNQYSELVLSGMSYDEQKNYLLSKYAIKSDFYSFQFKQLSCRADDIIVNCPELQHAWATEHESDLGIEELIYSQVNAFAPDIIFLDDISKYDYLTIASLKSKCKLLIGEIFNRPDNYHTLAEMDLVLCSNPEIIEMLSAIDIRAIQIPFLFDSRVQESPINYYNRRYSASLIIGNSAEDIGLAKYLSANLPQISIFTSTYSDISEEITSLTNYLGNAVASNLYRLMSDSKIVICNNWADLLSTNPEFTPVIPCGCGALLISSLSDSLINIFDVGDEIINYRSNSEALALIKYYTEYIEESITISSVANRKVMQYYMYSNAVEGILNSISSIKEKKIGS